MKLLTRDEHRLFRSQAGYSDVQTITEKKGICGIGKTAKGLRVNHVSLFAHNSLLAAKK